MPPAFIEDIRKAGGRDRTLVRVKGVGIYDAFDALQRLSETHHIDVIPNHELAAQIEPLMGLQDGWLGGTGKAPDIDQLDAISDKLTDTYPNDLPFPQLGPTPEGGLFLEWRFGPWRVSAEFPLPGSCELQATNTETHETRNADIAIVDAGSWTSIYEFVRVCA